MNKPINYLRFVCILIMLTSGSTGYAQPSDSGHFPIRTPFTIGVQINGERGIGIFTFDSHTGGYDQSDGGTTVDTLRFQIRVDTLAEHFTYSSNSDTLNCQYTSPTDTLVISFVERTHTVSKIHYVREHSGFINGMDTLSRQGFELVNLKYDSTSIFTSFPTLSECLDTCWDYYSESQYHHGSDAALISISSIDLFSVFRPIHLSNQASVNRNVVGLNSSLSIQPIHGLLECTFDPSEHSRILEVYSPLGVRIGCIEIAPEQQSIMIPRLGVGLFFFRLNGVVAKAYLPSD